MSSVVRVTDVCLLLSHHALLPLRQRSDEATIGTDVWLTGPYVCVRVLEGGNGQTMNHVT